MRVSIGATVSIVDASAEAAVLVLQAGGNATVAASSVFVDAVSLGGSVIDDAWHGIDLHNVLAVRRVGKLLSANISVAMKWLEVSGPGQAGNSCLKIAQSMTILTDPATPFA